MIRQAALARSYSPQGCCRLHELIPRYLGQRVKNVRRSFIGQAIHDPRSIPPGIYQLRFAQNAQVLRHIRLPQPQQGPELAGAALSTSKHSQHLEPRGMSQRLHHPGLDSVSFLPHVRFALSVYSPVVIYYSRKMELCQVAVKSSQRGAALARLLS